MTAVAVGETLGHYRIIGRLGAGGMGEVFSAEDLKLQRKVAIKVMPDAVAHDAQRRQRFEREAKTVAALSHPHIVTIHAVEELDGRLFMVMELIPGRPLSEVIPRGGLAHDRFFEWAVDLADAVGAAHQVGITHRDLKPQNIMISDDGRLKVLDFGLAKVDVPESGEIDLLAPTATLTTEGKIVGTVQYMSPEQAQGRRVDHRSDIFSLGVVFFEMATGHLPFQGESSMSLIASILRDQPPALVMFNAALPPRLERIIRRCLEKEPARRYQSALDLRSDLEEVRFEARSAEMSRPPVSTSGVTAPVILPSSTSGEKATPAPRRRLRALVTVAGAALAAFAIGWVVHGLVRRAPPPPPRAPRIETLAQLTTDPGAELTPSLAPDGEWFVYAGRVSGNWEIYWQRTDGENPQNLTRDPADDTDPAISPDGKRIAFRSERQGGGIFLMGATGESVRRLAEIGHHPTWVPDGSELVYTTERVEDPRFAVATSEAWAINVQTGARRRITEGHAVHAVPSPRGRQIAFWSARKSGARDLFTAPLAGGPPVALTDDLSLDFNPVWAPDGSAVYFASDRGGAINLWRIPVDETRGAATGPPEPLTTAVIGWSYAPSLSRDGRSMIFVAGGPRTQIERVRFDPVKEQAVGNPQPITVGDVSWAFGDKIAFQMLNPPGRLAIANADGSARRRLTDDKYVDRVPRAAPGGGRIAFMSDRSGGRDLWVVAIDGSAPRQLTASGDLAAPVWSPDGKRIAAYRMKRGAIVFDPDQPWGAQKPEELPPLPVAGELFFPFDWSPDGSQIAGFAITSDRVGRAIWVYTVATRSYRAFATEGEADSPVWLPDSRRLLYVADSNSLRLIDTAGNRTRTVLPPSPDGLEHPSITGGGTWIYFSRRTVDGDVWMARLLPPR